MSNLIENNGWASVACAKTEFYSIEFSFDTRKMCDAVVGIPHNNISMWLRVFLLMKKSPKKQQQQHQSHRFYSMPSYREYFRIVNIAWCAYFFLPI